SVNSSFSTITHYEKGKRVSSYSKKTGFEVSSSTSFTVEFSCTAFSSADGNTLDIRNLTFHILTEEDVNATQGSRWNPLTQDIVQLNGKSFDTHYKTGIYVASTTPKAIIEPGPNGNAGQFEENRYYIEFYIGWRDHLERQGVPILLDQNIQPGTYTTTMTLTAIPSVS
ncbi:MAG: hypothetical protein AAF824_18390, partial [Bacteroidota bacterium]